jgi:predicted ArsR family transcriptional regulator
MDVIGLSASEVHVLKIAASMRRGALIDHVAAEAGLSRNAAQVRLRGLKNQGLLEVRSMRFGGFVKYRITERGRKALAQLARTSK